IQDRGYVLSRGQALVPSWVAFAVIRLLEDHFGQLIDYDFTAAMESDLDEIASGETDRTGWLNEFYFGAHSETKDRVGLRELVDNLGEIDARDINSVPLGEGLTLRVRRYGRYGEDTSVAGGEGENPPRASVPEGVAPDEVSVGKARGLLETQGAEDNELGVGPVSGNPIVAKTGRFGP